MTLGAGGHELAFRFVGGSRASDEPLAELDWAHVGTGEPGEPYAAPTRADVVRQATAGGRSLRALSLRAPGFVRCAGWLPANATLEASLSTAGDGEGQVEARLLRDRRPPVVLGAARARGPAAGWSPWVIPVTGLEGAGALASIELAVTGAGKGTRVLLGEPRIIATDASAADEPPPARGVVLVVLGSTSAKSLGPWGGSLATPELARLGATGMIFDANRSPSSLASAVVASMLTGLSPRAHGVDDPNARLTRATVTSRRRVVRAAPRRRCSPRTRRPARRSGSIAAGTRSSPHDPLEEVPATRVFDDAAAWIEEHKGERFFVLVHARGGHPPWDVTAEELSGMPPQATWSRRGEPRGRDAR